jgi:hypothetical protein
MLSRRALASSMANGLMSGDLGPRLLGVSTPRAPASRCRRQSERPDEYSPSRRRMAPIPPVLAARSTSARMRSWTPPRTWQFWLFRVCRPGSYGSRGGQYGLTGGKSGGVGWSAPSSTSTIPARCGGIGRFFRLPPWRTNSGANSGGIREGRRLRAVELSARGNQVARFNLRRPPPRPAVRASC